MSDIEEAKDELATFVEGDLIEAGDGILDKDAKEMILTRLTTEEMLPKVLDELGITFSDFRKSLEEDDDFRQGYQMWQSQKGDMLRMNGLDCAQAPFPKDMKLNERRFMLEHRKMIINQLNELAKSQDSKMRNMSPKPTRFTLNLGLKQ